jgi:integrase
VTESGGVTHAGSLAKNGLSSTAGYRPLRNLALIDLLFASGMRVGDVSSLDVKDFVAEEGMLSRNI